MSDAAGLSIELKTKDGKARARNQDEAALVAVFRNTGAAPIALTFWWSRRLRVVDAATGAEVAPGPGPVLPCGVAEDLTVLAPGESVEHDEPFGCTQPAGETRDVGWSYALGAGTWKVSLVFEFPPAHGRTETSDARAWRGRVETNAVTLTLDEALPARGASKPFWKRLFG